MHAGEIETTPRATACAPCGPECRFARPLSNWPDFVWCLRRGAPRRIDAADCAAFAFRRGMESETSEPPPRESVPRDELSLTLFT
jgi:hypothetical protein